MKVATCWLIAVLALVATPTVTRAATLFTIAGMESTTAVAPTPCRMADFCAVPRSWPRVWTATKRRLKATCLTHLADGTVLICQGHELLALGHDGRLRHWLPATAGLGVGSLIDADVAGDGSVVVLGRSGVARVLAGGIVRTLVNAPAQPGDTWLGSAIAAMPDGSAWVSEFDAAGSQIKAADLVRVGPDGHLSVVRHALPVGRDAQFTSDPYDDLVALPDGSALIAQQGQRRVLRVDPTGAVRVVAGGGHGFAEGARATAVDLGAVTAVTAARGSGVLLSADRGLFVIDRTGRLRRVTRGTASEYDPTEPRALTTDGRLASQAALVGVRRLDLLDGGTILALVNGADGETHVTSIAPAQRQPRLAIALPATDRASLRRGRLDVLATRSAHAEITIEHGGRVLDRARVSLRAGRNRLRMRVASRPDAQVVRVSATGADGGVATHRLAFLSDRRLSARELQRARRLVEQWGSLAVNWFSIHGCARTTPWSFSCRWTDIAEGDLLGRGRAVISVRPDGLIDFTSLTRSGRSSYRLFYEPR